MYGMASLLCPARLGSTSSEPSNGQGSTDLGLRLIYTSPLVLKMVRRLPYSSLPLAGLI